MKTIKLTKENLKKAIRETVLALKAGEVLEVPTDTVSGLICDYYNKSAEKEIFRLKKRPEEKILPIFISSISEVKKLVPVNRRQEKFMEKVWPGKVTCVLKKDVGGFRIPGDKFILKLLQKFGGPLLQTSANISGELPAGGAPSTVVDITGEDLKILREGAVSGEELQRIWDLI
ncbi:hypothetical protein A3H04_01325 [Candidatus Giovannonibacteria bacterium RIFCSPLOWO2_12_FULL_43_11c]|uniref:L-threonylcarbamoyladenylate synthase n=1 Tax=Candidatus Giovannonibacteria bacterium RIFCSPHIGHO2_12_FULL_43_15 TaxID=1798341 RepID=A0A1F5WQZ5_9BACT|nr:MAG: hypothetical protein A3B97_01160 [Candidatus Giovannonibacteria bacterium RIFCSPHIGHO2_02_FULL_43_32]OGF78085.1 MAG: hypothetical protein A3F23_02685 [Candidatus Giovannonibacteria bacterium RIFCSPHIGHO2_12_FULL_43_15]OGF78828.1 MAG: hypothetical protein A3A15_00375 [Candidatus Giovannonibacteria bacterium RIFCSPLOWO2_01_FULL_43_60]OGF92356.1 MAG: hypothetical protein A3H04_01325 [Candidatus Giovannonibacteria bacterium RIFCSPLOWO2_12_FULL_43_11c]